MGGLQCLADQAIQAVAWLSTLVVGGMLLVAWLTKSRALLFSTSILTIASIVTCGPAAFMAFAPLDPDEALEMDLTQADFMPVAFIWLAVCVAVAVSTIIAFASAGVFPKNTHHLTHSPRYADPDVPSPDHGG